MLKPQSKVEVIYNDLQQKLLNGEELSEFEYKRTLKILQDDDSDISIGAIGFAHAVMGCKDEAIDWFESHSPLSSFILFRTYGAILKELGENKRLFELSFKYADFFKDIWFSWMSFEHYYIIGDISNSARKAREYLSMIPNNINKQRAEHSISMQLDSLNLVYQSGNCTPAQFKEVSDIAIGLLDKYSLRLLYVEVFYFDIDSMSYMVGIHPPSKYSPLAGMDMSDILYKLCCEVTDETIAATSLRHCDLIIDFSDGGASNWRFIHGIG